MKKLLSIILPMVLLISCFGVLSVSAEDKITITIDGAIQSYDVSPVIVNGRTLVPMRAIFESLGANVEWNESSRTVTATAESTVITLGIDKTEATVDGEKIALDVPAQIVDSRTMVPARFVAEALKCDVKWVEGTKTVAINKNEAGLKSTVPQTQWQRDAIARARQLTDVTYTPVRDIPTYVASKKKGVLEAGTEYKGMPYSSTEVADKVICENVSFETFLSAVSNPDSVLYTKDISYIGNGSATAYGVVCTSLARYCLGIEGKFVTYWWLDVPGMEKIAEKGTYTVDDLELCDVLYAWGEGRNHVGMVTDILRDENGNIAKVEVSEAVRSTCKRATYTPEEFGPKWEKFHLTRYTATEKVPAFDEEVNRILTSGLDKEKPLINVDYGNKSNYIEGETTVISVFAEGENTVEIFKDGELIEEVTFTAITSKGREKLERKFEKGYYEVRLKGTDEYAEFCVCRPEISHTTDGKGNITVTIDSGDEQSIIEDMDFRGPAYRVVRDIYYGDMAGHVELTAEERETGVVTREMPFNTHHYKVYFKNKYGIWTAEMIKIEEDK